MRGIHEVISYEQGSARCGNRCQQDQGCQLRATARHIKRHISCQLSSCHRGLVSITGRAGSLVFVTLARQACRNMQLSLWPFGATCSCHARADNLKIKTTDLSCGRPPLWALHWVIGGGEKCCVLRKPRLVRGSLPHPPRPRKKKCPGWAAWKGKRGGNYGQQGHGRALSWLRPLVPSATCWALHGPRGGSDAL